MDENDDLNDFENEDEEEQGQGRGEGEEEEEEQQQDGLPGANNNLHISMDDDIDLDDETVWPGRIEDTTPEKKWYKKFSEYITDKYTPVVSPLNKALTKIKKFLANVFEHDRYFKVHHVLDSWDSLISECVQHINIGINIISKFEPKVQLYERTTIDKNSPTHIAKIILYDIFAIDAVMTKKTRYGREAKKILDNWFEDLHESSFITGLSLRNEITKCLNIFNKNNPSKKKMAENGDDDSLGGDEDNNQHYNSFASYRPTSGNYTPTATTEKKYSLEKLFELTIKAVKKNHCKVITLIIKKLNEYGTTEINKTKKRKLQDKLLKYINLSEKVGSNIKEIKNKLKNIKS